jgi:hypothetical protein
MNVQRRDTLCGVSFDTVAYMATIEYVFLYYALNIPLLGGMLNYFTNTMLKNGTPSPPNNLAFNISQ